MHVGARTLEYSVGLLPSKELKERGSHLCVAMLQILAHFLSVSVFQHVLDPIAKKRRCNLITSMIVYRPIVNALRFPYPTEIQVQDLIKDFNMLWKLCVDEK